MPPLTGQFRWTAGEYGGEVIAQHCHPDRDEFVRGRRLCHAFEYGGAGYNQLIGPDHRVARGRWASSSPLIQPGIAHIYGSGVTVQNVTSGSPAEEAV